MLSTCSRLLDLLKSLDKYNKYMPVPLDANSRESNFLVSPSPPKYTRASFIRVLNPSLESDSMFGLQFLDYEPYTWIIDCEQICSLLLGRCIYNRMLGDLSFDHIDEWKHWLRSDLLYEGLVKLVGWFDSNDALALSEFAHLHKLP